MLVVLDSGRLMAIPYLGTNGACRERRLCLDAGWRGRHEAGAVRRPARCDDLVSHAG